MAHEPEAVEDSLLESFLGLQTPEGTRAELIEGEIVVTPPPDGDHEDCIGRVVEQVVLHSAVRMRFAGNKGLRLSGGGRCPRDHAIPDAAFAPADKDVFRGAPPWMPPDGLALVVEVTSTRPERDRTAKRHCYARAGIPLYLLVDRDLSRTTLFALPEDDEYTEVHLAPFGKPLELPAPFSFTLETEGF
ncbi:Uma2 family endonuclease [Streptacidiphilus sp. ASG 303]|uniref:Uma2 family endonuclease n=1 Tax=Streptacidiphilus sp. ASG 303 TaxID=2896847 RepID=UPI001E496A9D|nr:Uma2 family endonuclease [Streptacidiphilus sp. ASG 303]MCD0483151.1 Uma2 family endonuclease [Streptacidiphilus sp. ASG 303]